MLYRAVPRYETRIWGSLTLPEASGPVGEVWWIYQDADGSTQLTGPGGEKASVAALVSSGRLPGRDRYPVLLKTLHTADRLSVQVHPGIRGGTLFKEETWIVLAAEEGAWMMGGLACADRDSFLRAVEEGTAADLMRRIPLRTGDAFHIPPGTVHALGPGLTVLEAQSNCDVTYRLYDWGRVDGSGVPRELHTVKGADAVDWADPGGPVFLGSGGGFRSGDLRARYTITTVSGTMESALPAGGLFFLSRGRAFLEGVFEAPCCILADSDGGAFGLEGGGYVIEP